MTTAPHTDPREAGLPTVACLLPAATEIACALGLRSRLVGVSHECDWPDDFADLPRLTRARLGPPRASAEVDAEVRALLAEALSVYAVDVEALERAAPDVVVTQDLCDVCAVPAGAVRSALEELSSDAELVRLGPTTLAGVWEDVLRVARATGTEERAERLLAELEGRIAAVRDRSAALAERPRVLTLEWLSPVMVGGLWMPELVELAGGLPLVTRVGQHAPTLSAAELADLDPDVVLVKPCGYGLDATLAEADVLRALVAAAGWDVAERGGVWVADGNAYFNRPGPRLVESLEILAACVHPGAFGDLARRHAASFRRFA